MSSSLECSQTSITCGKQSSFHIFNGKCELNFESCDCIKDSNATVSIIQLPLMCFGAFRQYEMTKTCWAAKWSCWLILWVYCVCSQRGSAPSASCTCRGIRRLSPLTVSVSFSFVSYRFSTCKMEEPLFKEMTVRLGVNCVVWSVCLPVCLSGVEVQKMR